MNTEWQNRQPKECKTANQKYEKQAGAELCQAQVKLEIVDEVLAES